MDFSIDMNKVVDKVLDLNKSLTLENTILQQTLAAAAQEIDALKAEVDGLRYREATAVDTVEYMEEAISTP